MLVGKNYKIESDPLNVTLYKKSVSKEIGKESWRAEGYFSTIKNALDYLVELEVKLTGMKDFTVVAKRQEELHSLIKGLSLPQEALQSLRKASKV